MPSTAHSVKRTPTLLDHNPQNFLLIIRDLERVFFYQILRLKGELGLSPHAPGQRKPDLAEQEAKLLGNMEED